MRPRVFVSAAVATVIVAGAAFLLLQVMHGGKYPLRTDAQDFFEARKNSLESLYQQLIEDGYASVLCYPDKVFAGFDPRGPGQPVLGSAQEDYLSLCAEASVGKGWRTETGFLFYIGPAATDMYDFNLAYVRLDGRPTTVPDCRLMEPSGDFGKCQFELDTDWRLDYEWLSRATIP